MSGKLQDTYGPWALVTGASSGIGTEFARQLAAKGLNLVLVARRQDVLDTLAQELTSAHGVGVRTVAADLSAEAGIDTVCGIEEEIGFLVHSAGLEVNGAFETTDVAAEEAMIQLNVMSTFRLTHHFCKGMVARGKGGILLVSSLAGHMPNPYFATYAGTKAYVLNFGASLRSEFTSKGVDVHVLSPGPTDTPMASNTGVDWSQVPAGMMQVSDVVAETLDNMGRKFLTAPGFQNKMAVWMAKHLPSGFLGKMNAKVMRKAMNPAKSR